MLVLRNFFFCCNVFTKQSAAEASESVYMRERVHIIFNLEHSEFVFDTVENFVRIFLIFPQCLKTLLAENVLYEGHSESFETMSI